MLPFGYVGVDMKPIKFPGVNIVFAEDQPEYQPLPAMILQDRECSVITCWELTEDEIETLTKTRKLFLKQLTFGNPLQPILPTTDLSEGIDLF